MPEVYVNLDALIPREDFEAKEGNSAGSNISSTQAITELEKGRFFYSVLKKPDFQRETANWTPEKVAELVKSFVADDLVPSIILWKSPINDVFVIDGAHRLSSLVAWVRDDYGDGEISRDFFNHVIDDAQRETADKTRRIIAKEIGSYEDLKFAIANPSKAKVEHVERAKRLGSLAINVQWVTGDAKKAEQSFFKINQQGTAIDSTELSMLKARSSPNALAARAIIRAGLGHKYWGNFPASIQDEIETAAKAIYENLFRPALQTPIKTLDVPVAGKAYSAQALPLIFDLVNLANDAVVGRVVKELEGDHDGTMTLQFLKTVKKMAFRISGNHPSSLGLHPLVYFYGPSGRFQPTSFFGIVALIKKLDKKDSFSSFSSVRRRFEDFLLGHKHFPNQITQKSGSGLKGYSRVLYMYELLMQSLLEDKTDEEVEQIFQSDSQLSFLRLEETSASSQFHKDFSTDTKSAVYLAEAKTSMLPCKICHGYMHKNSISVDHIQDKKLGGVGEPTNAQLSHPYCNSTYKDILAEEEDTSLHPRA